MFLENSKLSLQNQEREFPVLEKEGEKVMISTVDRKRIFIFVAIAYGLSIAVYLMVYLGGRPSGSYPDLAKGRIVLMFAPMIAAIATRLITHEGWSNTFLRPDFRCGRWRYYLAAWFLPPLATTVGGAIYYQLFPGHFDPSMTSYRALTEASTGSAMEPWMFFITQVGLGIVLTPLSLTLILSLGEEFGWRGYLLPKLMPLGPRKAVLLVGVIWGAWHWPGILMGSDYGFDYWGAPVVGPLLFLVTTCFASAFYAWVTLRSGSIWPAALGHGASNAANRLVWIFFGGELNPLLGPGAQGIIGSLGYAVLALLIIFNPRALAQPASAPGNMDLSGNPKASKKAADQVKPGTTS